MKRNITLDYFKFILCIMIILLHIPLLHLTESDAVSIKQLLVWAYDRGLARIAVPCFFLLNGYFINIKDEKKMKKYITHLLLIYVVWELFYLPSFADKEYKMIIYQFVFGFEHLWYVSALLGGATILFLYNKYFGEKHKTLLILSLILFALGCFIQSAYPFISSTRYRNFLVYGFPFIAVGYLIRQINIENLKKYAKYTLLLGVLFLYIESYLRFTYTTANANGGDSLFSLIILCPSLFILVLSKSKVAIADSFIADLASAMYFIHPFILKIIVSSINIHGIYLAPLIITLTLFAAYIIVSINKRINIFI